MFLWGLPRLEVCEDFCLMSQYYHPRPTCEFGTSWLNMGWLSNSIQAYTSAVNLARKNNGAERLLSQKRAYN